MSDGGVSLPILDKDARAMKTKELMQQLSLQQKAALCGGSGSFRSSGIRDGDQVKVPCFELRDGTHALRDTRGGDVVYPPACTTAASFDPKLLEPMGVELGKACRAREIAVLLGPGMNIKRGPLCGRNFEYFSEDPLLTSRMATALVKGMQSCGVGACLKHYAANNQENFRMGGNSAVDERTLREIYLAAFEGTVREAKPWVVMCSYNKVNGVYASENEYLLTEVLRRDWGFDGLVISDWGAVHDRPAACRAGLDLQMPGPTWKDAQIIQEAVEQGTLDEKFVDQCAERVIDLALKAPQEPGPCVDLDAEHELAREIAENCFVLLKNDEHILPLDPSKKIAFIGAMASNPTWQGGGTSHCEPPKSSSAYSAVSEIADVAFAKGYSDDTWKVRFMRFPFYSFAIDEALERKAVETAQNADIAVVFVGVPCGYESEGFDREHMDLPENQTHLIEAVTAVQENVVIVLHNGSPVSMPWINRVKGVLELYLAGQAVGEATVNTLFGKVNPSGRLPETFPVKLEDNPSHGNYGEEEDVYKEGVFVGYRYYDTNDVDVLFPFGFGLSYTTFDYSNLRLSRKENGEFDIHVDVTNTGSVAGKEVVQLYVSDKTGHAVRPRKELKDFTKVLVPPGETRTVEMHLCKRSFAYWKDDIHSWYAPSGKYEVLVCKSVRDVVLTAELTIDPAYVIAPNE